jgi:DNA-binding CsgD family transcriptional regulator
MNPLSLTPDILPEMIGRLTPRQLEIVELLAQGYNAVQVGDAMGISFETVKHQIYLARRKLELENRTQLIVVFVMHKTHTEYQTL